MNKITHPQKLSNSLKADHHHKVILKFGVQDKASKERITVHQAFVRLYSQGLNQEIVYVAESSDSNNNLYKFDLDVSLIGTSLLYEVQFQNTARVRQFLNNLSNEFRLAPKQKNSEENLANTKCIL